MVEHYIVHFLFSAHLSRCISPFEKTTKVFMESLYTCAKKIQISSTPCIALKSNNTMRPSREFLRNLQNSTPFWIYQQFGPSQGRGSTRQLQHIKNSGPLYTLIHGDSYSNVNFLFFKATSFDEVILFLRSQTSIMQNTQNTMEG